MVHINVTLTVLAVVSLPSSTSSAHLRGTLFPLSWVTMARTADIATLVDENINGVRVIKSFAAEKQQITELGRRGPAPAVGRRRDDVARARFGPLSRT